MSTVVQSAIVLAATAFARIAEILRQVGEWISRAIEGAAQVVAQAVEAAAKVVSQFLDWIVDFVAALVKVLLKPILDAIDQFVASVKTTIQAVSLELRGLNPSPEEHADRAAQMVVGLILGGTYALFVALAVALWRSISRPNLSRLLRESLSL